MLIQRASDILPSEITPERVYQNRREFVKAALFAPLTRGAQAPGSGDKLTPIHTRRRTTITMNSARTGRTRRKTPASFR